MDFIVSLIDIVVLLFQSIWGSVGLFFAFPRYEQYLNKVSMFKSYSRDVVDIVETLESGPLKMSKNSKTILDIGALSNLSGVNSSTIRTWENRYKALVPGKTDTGRRLYREDDVGRLILLRNLLGRGHKISNLANLTTEDLQDLFQIVGPAQPTDHDAQIDDDLLSTINDYDIARFRRILSFRVAELSPHDAVTRVFQPIQRLIGERWHAGSLDVAQEHMLSEAMRAQLLNSIEGLKVAESGPLVAFATLSREQHEFGALMACYLASSQQFRTIYVGANVPPSDLATSARRTGVKLIVVSSIFVPDVNLAEIRILADQIDAPIWLGCDPGRIPKDAAMPKNLMVIKDFSHFKTCLKDFPRQE